MTEHRGQTIKTDKIVYIYRHPLDVFHFIREFRVQQCGLKVEQSCDFEIENVESLDAAAA